MLATAKPAPSMVQSKPKNNRAKQSPSKGIEQLLADQTSVILQAVEVRLAAHENRIDKRIDDLELPSWKNSIA